MSRIEFLSKSIFVLSLAAMAGPLQAATIYDAAGDYLAGWTAGNNPNGAWSYGWSTVAGGTLTLYPVNGKDVAGFPQLDSWSDPTNRVGNVPDVRWFGRLQVQESSIWQPRSQAGNLA